MEISNMHQTKTEAAREIVAKWMQSPKSGWQQDGSYSNKYWSLGTLVAIARIKAMTVRIETKSGVMIFQFNINKLADEIKSAKRGEGTKTPLVNTLMKIGAANKMQIDNNR